MPALHSTSAGSVTCESVHRLDQLTPNIPAKLFYCRALTMRAELQTDLAGIFSGFGALLEQCVVRLTSVPSPSSVRRVLAHSMRRAFHVAVTERVRLGRISRVRPASRILSRRLALSKSLLVANLALFFRSGLRPPWLFDPESVSRACLPVRITYPAVRQPSRYDAPSHG